MDRRTVLKGAALAGAALAPRSERPPHYGSGSGAPGPAGDAGPCGEPREFRLVTTWPKNFPGLGTAPENVARRVEEASGGRLKIRVYAAGELVGAFESFDAVSTGIADMYHGAEYYWQGKSRAFNFFTAVPFGLTAQEINAWIQHGGGQALWDELSARYNVKALPCGNTGVQMGGWFKREIKTLEDFKGLKIRMPGLGGEVMRRLGAAAVALPGGEIFQSLQTGAIDATEWVGPWNDLAFGFYRAAPFYYVPGFHEPGAQLSLGINLGVWQSLSRADQAIIEHACLAETLATFAEYNTRNAEALRVLIERHGVALRTFSDEIFAEIGRVSAEVVAEQADGDDLSRRIYDSYLAARSTGMDWGPISDEGFARVRRLFPGG